LAVAANLLNTVSPSSEAAPTLLLSHEAGPSLGADLNNAILARLENQELARLVFVTPYACYGSLKQAFGARPGTWIVPDLLSTLLDPDNVGFCFADMISSLLGDVLKQAHVQLGQVLARQVADVLSHRSDASAVDVVSKLCIRWYAHAREELEGLITAPPDAGPLDALSGLAEREILSPLRSWLRYDPNNLNEGPTLGGGPDDLPEEQSSIPLSFSRRETPIRFQRRAR
jgi:hypothetical protein